MVFPNAASEFVFMRTYSRWLEEEKRRETWDEAVDRYMDFIEKYTGDRVPQKVFKKIRTSIYNMEVMPSMRAFWAAGKAAESTAMTIYNCSFLTVDSIDSFAECLYILMCGTGVGFSVQKKYIDKLPEVPIFQGDGGGTFVVDDSKEGWADSVKHLLQALYAGKDLTVDYSKIRGRGVRLKTFGGQASGSAPLIALHDFIRKIFENAQGRKLKSIECHDIMNKIAEVVIVGGSRRSSQISFSDLDDSEMANAKIWPFPLHRAMANNSVCYEEKPGAINFLEEWAKLAKSGTGERGISNLQGAKKRCPERRDKDKLMGANPCFTGDMYLQTLNGKQKFEDLKNQQIQILNSDGEYVSGKVWSNGIKEVIEIKLSNSNIIKCTPDHVFMLNNGKECKAKDLKKKRIMPSFSLKRNFGPMFQLGFLQGDGNLTRLNSNEHKGLEVNIGEKDRDICEYFNIQYEEGKTAYYINGFNNILKDLEFCPYLLHERILPQSFDKWEFQQKCDFISGLYSANGCVLNRKGQRITLKSSCFDLIVGIREFLESCNIDSYITTNKSKTIKFNNGSYVCKQSYDLNISRFNSIIKFSKLFGFAQRYKRDNLELLIKTKSPMVLSIKNNGEKEVFDFSLASNPHWGVISSSLNGVNFIAHNCHEIILRDRGLCNLSEVVIRPEDDLDDLMEKIETAVWIGAIQSTFTKFRYVSKKWKKNCEDERLLGVSLTGQMDNHKLLTPDALSHMKKKAIKVAKHASKILGINMPAAITCTKPSGSVSQVVDSSSGLHPRFSKFYIRRYRIASIDPLFKMMKFQGVKFNPENGQREEDWKKAQQGDLGVCTIYEKGKRWSEDKVNTWVAEFPVSSPKNSIIISDMTAIQQLEHYKKIQKYWCEHCASCTVYVKEGEWFEVGNWVYQNWKYITGVSFLPHDGGHYEQAPYEEISEDKFNQMIKEFPKIDYSKLKDFESEDNTEGAKTFACTGDKCELQ